MFDSLSDAFRIDLARVLMVVVAVGIILLLRNLIAWLLAKPIKRLLDRTGQAGMDETIRSVVSAPTNYLLLALALDVGARLLEVDPGVMDFVAHVTRTLVIIALALALYRLIGVSTLSRRRLFAFTGLSIDEALLPFIGTMVGLLLWVLVLVIVIQVWGYDVSGLIAGLGIGGLAISLAAQDTLSNLFGFAAIVSDRPFVVGEYVKTKDVEGTIERVGLRSTRVRQIDQALVAVPNSMLAGSAVLNWSRLAKRKVELLLGVSYQTRPDEMETLLKRLRETLKAHPKVDPNAVVVFFVGFGESSLNIQIRCYLSIADWTAFTAEQELILLEIMRVVESLNLQIAFPSRSIYLENLGDLTLPSAEPLQQPAHRE